MDTIVLRKFVVDTLAAQGGGQDPRNYRIAQVDDFHTQLAIATRALRGDHLKALITGSRGHDHLHDFGDVSDWSQIGVAISGAADTAMLDDVARRRSTTITETSWLRSSAHAL